MARTISTDVFNPQVLTDAVRGQLQGKNAFMGSSLMRLGAAAVSGSMPIGGPKAIGQNVTVPYFGTIGEFAANAESGSGNFMSAITPAKIQQTSEQGTVTRASLSFEVDRWAEGNFFVNPAVGDPYAEAARQIEVAATREMDRQLIAQASASGAFVKDVYSSTSPQYMNWDLLIDSKFEGWGDEQDDIAGVVVHSHTMKDIMKMKATDGRPLVLPFSQGEVNGVGSVGVGSFGDLPLIVSDRVPVTGSSMGAVTASGTTPPTVTLSGTPKGPYKLVIDIVVGGALATATFRFSVDGGNTWSATMATAASVPLTDTAIDSLVGVNGATGITAAFASATYNADNLYTSTASLKAMSLLVKKNALAFWYSSQHLTLQTAVDILADSDLAAMHLYAVPYRYRRIPGGTHCGVVQITHNVSNY